MVEVLKMKLYMCLSVRKIVVQLGGLHGLTTL